MPFTSATARLAGKASGRARRKAVITYCGSMAEAAAILMIARDRVRQVKNSGCPAFRSGRIYLAPLREWLQGIRTSPYEDSPPP